MKDIETTGFVRPKFKKISTGVNHYCLTILPNLQNVATLCVRTKVRELMAWNNSIARIIQDFNQVTHKSHPPQYAGKELMFRAACLNERTRKYLSARVY